MWVLAARGRMRRHVLRDIDHLCVSMVQRGWGRDRLRRVVNRHPLLGLFIATVDELGVGDEVISLLGHDVLL